ncbi:PspC domain-containing protein [Nesterenkonia rhizosphaerae]|uniref:Phage shock protein PspC N-terminal domain-containing protein n=1 Tax=Nesterenkonia rhizosphaerae TaxID=1348272 RepID=A0ABP9FR22_9MICC
MDNAYSSAPHGEPGPGRPEAGHQLFNWIRSTGISRPEGGWAGGVFAAAAQRLGWDAALVRGLGVVAFILFFSPTALIYGLAWLFLPDTHGRIHAQQALRGEYPSGLWGAAGLTLIGAVNVFTPVSIAGPFAVLLNLMILGVVAWVVYLIFRNWRHSDAPSPYDAPDAGRGHTGTGSRPFSPAESSAGSSADDDGSARNAQRPDGKPAWYPKETAGAAASSAAEHGDPTSSATGPAAGGYAGAAAGTRSKPAGYSAPVTPAEAPEPAEDPREREARRRRRLVTLGILLLALPLLAAAAWFGAGIGLSSPTAVLVALAGLVALLGLANIVSGLRGRKGRTGLLMIFTVLMMVLFSGYSTGIDGRGANYVFGDYYSDSQSVNTAFSNTTVDLRQLREQMAQEAGEDPQDPDWGYSTSVEINSAFANTTVIVPDNTHVVTKNAHALSNMEIRAGDFWHNVAGFGTPDVDFGNEGPTVPTDTIELNLNSAFGNLTIYDASTYDQEVLGNWDESDWTEEDQEAWQLEEYHDTGFMDPEYRSWLRELELDDNYENYLQWQEEVTDDE